MPVFGSDDEKDRRETEKALKQLGWAFKAAGMSPEQLQGVIYGEEPHILLLTEDEVIWARKGALRGGKVEGRISRSSVVGFKRDTGWTSDNLVFETSGASLPKGNKFPYGGDRNFENKFNFLNELSRGALTAGMTDEDRENPIRWHRDMSVRIPAEEPPQVAPPPPPPPPPVAAAPSAPTPAPAAPAPPASPPTPAPPAGVPSAGPAGSGDIPAQLQKLAELKDAGILTEEEFAAKKQELLARM